MTTVINYNFFGLNTDPIFGDLGFKNRSSDKKQNHSPKEERTIDVTAQSRVLDDDFIVTMGEMTRKSANAISRDLGSTIHQISAV